MSDKNYYREYYQLITKKLIEQNFTNITKIEKKLQKFIKNKKNKVIIFGNGGSASIAAHVSVDLTKMCNIRAVTFNEPNLLTCFSNDYGYENWIKKAIEFHGQKGDLVIFISSSGKSKNMINAAKYCKNKIDFITLTGFIKNNPLKKIGKLNIWVNSKKYNFIENIHQIILLSVVDKISKIKL